VTPGHFRRWPTWIWANKEVAELIELLRHLYEELSEDERIGFYCLRLRLEANLQAAELCLLVTVVWEIRSVQSMW
jgi:erythromycin esterase-like protein